MSVNITVKDVNDNGPRFVFPSYPLQATTTVNKYFGAVSRMAPAHTDILTAIVSIFYLLRLFQLVEFLFFN